MPVLTDQSQMEAYVESNMLEMVADMADAVYGRLHPRLVACSFEQRTVEAVFAMQPWMRNGNNVVHGGVIATMLDSIGGVVARCFTPQDAISPTVTLQVSYLYAIPIDARVHVRAGVTFPGRRLLHICTEAFDAEDGTRLYATGTAMHYIKSKNGERSHAE